MEKAPAERTGLILRIRRGEEPIPRPAPTRSAAASPLDEAGARRVFNRLPAFKSSEGEVASFARREDSPPPPETGGKLKEPFPPKAGAGSAPGSPAEPLRVIRYAPQGEVPLAPHLSITFSQPMIAVGAPRQMDAQTRLVRLHPEQPGRWRWVGTSTLVFEPEQRFAMATDYQVEIPRGIASAVGAHLEEPVHWTFSTPPVQLGNHYPGDGPCPVNPIIFLAFDQRIDRQAMLGAIRIRSGGTVFPAVLADRERIAADPRVSELASEAPEGTWMAVCPRNPLPFDAAVRVEVASGAPSAEGPRKSPAVQAFEFRTHGPLAIVEPRCGWLGGGKCPALSPFTIRFSNPLDAEAFSAGQVRIAPPLPGFNAVVSGAYLVIQGASRGRTTYQVTLDAAIRDQFGQILGAEKTVAFKVTQAPAMLMAEGGPFVVLDPAARSRFPVYTINRGALAVRLYAVTPQDWEAFHDDVVRVWRGGESTPPGELRFSGRVMVNGDPDALCETLIDLSPALQNGLGQVVAVIEPDQRDDSRQAVRAWIQSTNIGLDAFADDTDLLVWATSLADGRPMADVELTLLPSGGRTQTGPDGLGALKLSAGSDTLLVARKGTDVALLPERTGPSYWYGSHGWSRTQPGQAFSWYVFDDRKLYRPGETVNVKGWLRRLGMGKGGDIDALEQLVSLDFVLKDSRGIQVAQGRRELGALAGFDLTLALPDDMHLGRAWLELTASSSGMEDAMHVHSLEIQEFRRPEFEVSASVSDGPHFIGTSAQVTAAAAYYAGGALADAEVTWHATVTPGAYVPPNRSDFNFGPWIAWWDPEPDLGISEPPQSITGRTDAKGQDHLRLTFESVHPPRPSHVAVEATVMDVNRQAWTASAGLLVHPASLYVGIRSARPFVQAGEPIYVELLATDLDGRAVPGIPVDVSAVRMEWTQQAGQWAERAVEVQDCAVESGRETAACVFKPREGGSYLISARVRDDQGRLNQSDIRVWVAGGRSVPSRRIKQEKVMLIPDRKAYAAGDVAELLVLAPFADAEGLLTVRRSGLVRSERFTMHGTSHVLTVPIGEADTPNLHVQVDLVGRAPRLDKDARPAPDLMPRPALATGTLNLQIPPRARRLGIALAPRETELEPGGRTLLDIDVRDADGAPVDSGELAVVVVDEAVLALSGYRLPDPLEVFYGQRSAGVRDHHLRTAVLLTDPDQVGVDLAGRMKAGGAGLERGIRAATPPQDPIMTIMPSAAEPEALGEFAASAQQKGPPIRLRSDFNALALFAPAVFTDARGQAQVSIQLPDNLTRYRIMVAAVAGARRFGSAETVLTARLPLMVRPSPPRFLNMGDRCELPVVVQNQTAEPVDARVVLRAANAHVHSPGGQRLGIPAHGRVEVRFPVVTTNAGTARFQAGVVAGAWADAAEFGLPVWTPATTEAFAAYGQIETGAVAQPVAVPQRVWPQFGGLEITTASTALQALTDAVIYLSDYPFECAEQLSSRVLGIAALRDVLAALRTGDLPAPEDLEAAVQRDIARLESLQNADGGFAFWRRGDASWPYISIHAAHALMRAKEKGFVVPPATIARSQTYLRGIEGHFPDWYGQRVRQTLNAYALYVRARMQDTDPARARALIRETAARDLPLEAAAWLLPVLAADPRAAAEAQAVRRLLANRVEETASSAHFVTSYDDQGYLLLHSDRRVDAIALEALIDDSSGDNRSGHSDLIAKLAAGLQAHRKAGHWANTQENVFVLTALGRYFQVVESVPPDFKVSAWLGDIFAGSHAFKGRSTDRHQVRVPMRDLMEATPPGNNELNLILAKEGPGRLYYRIGMRSAPFDVLVPPEECGFAVERVYEPVDDPADVRRDPQGAWHIRPGASVRVRLTLAAPARRTHVALIDPLPAGLEALNPALAVTGSLPRGPSSDVTVLGAPGLGGPHGPGKWWWWIRPWFEHQNLRDERVEAFGSLLWEGVYTYTYYARATTPGSFIAPPPRAEEMYHPETFGRGQSDRVIVE